MSNFTKPTVTIDLEEYNYLKDKIEELSKQKDNEEYEMLSRIGGLCLEEIARKNQPLFTMINNEVNKLGYKIYLSKDQNGINFLLSYNLIVNKQIRIKPESNG